MQPIHKPPGNLESLTTNFRVLKLQGLGAPKRGRLTVASFMSIGPTRRADRHSSLGLGDASPGNGGNRLREEDQDNDGKQYGGHAVGFDLQYIAF